MGLFLASWRVCRRLASIAKITKSNSNIGKSTQKPNIRWQLNMPMAHKLRWRTNADDDIVKITNSDDDIRKNTTFDGRIKFSWRTNADATSG
jgi:hypothetical protein